MFYNTINNILREKLPEIKNNVDQYIYLKNYEKIISKIKCDYEKSIYTSQIIDWRCEIELNEELYDYNCKPYGLGCFWSMEIIFKRKLLYYNSGRMYNGFLENKNIREDFIVKFDEIDDDEIIKNMESETIKNIKIFSNNFTENLEIFVRGYKKIRNDKIEPGYVNDISNGGYYRNA